MNCPLPEMQGRMVAARIVHEPDVNATELDDSELCEGQCQCGDGVEIFDEEPIDFDD